MSQTQNSEEAWFQLGGDEALDALEASREGLNSSEVESRLERYGPNSIRSGRKISPWAVLLHQFMSPLVYVLIAAFVVTLSIQSFGDAIVIAIVLAVNGAIGFIQEYRAETAVQSLMKMVSPQARVRRDGRARQVDGDRLVPGDCVLLNEGDMVPADLRLLESASLQVDESALTGESVPVSKTVRAISEAEDNLPPADQENMAFMGTAVTSGRAEGLVVATGRRTQLGRIAEDVHEAGEIETPLQRRMDRLAKRIAAAILVVAVFAFGVGLWMGRPVDQMFLLAVSLSVAAIPAGLPVVMTVALAIGVRRMARQHAVIRHLPAVETLGSTTTILSDKTGTLTQNRMTVTQVMAIDDAYEVTGDSPGSDGELRKGGQRVASAEGTPLFETLLVGLLNNSAELVEPRATDASDGVERGEVEAKRGEQEQSVSERGDERRGQSGPSRGDPMEVALMVSAIKAGLDREELLERFPQSGEVPFQTERRFSATIHEVPEGDEGPLVLIKGAPEVILEMSSCRGTSGGGTAQLDRGHFERLQDDMASRGLRVLAMAVGRGPDAVESIRGEHPQGMTFVGMQGLMDPPRPEAIEAVDNCHRAGIRVIMVTGDHARTAAAIAHEVHIDQPVGHATDDSPESASGNSGEKNLPEVYNGQQLAELSDADLDEALGRVNVYARTRPAQKLRIVDRLKSQHQIVAVTGDGVNDAPALKSAHLGAAMGQSGTDVAKEASDMVITDDNFASVYAAVEQGRTAFRNIRMATFFLLSTGAADVMIILTALGLRWDLPLLPAQILWCNVVTNGIADVALGFETGEEALYRRKPRSPEEGVLDYVLLERLVVVGVWLAVGTLCVFWWVNFYRGESLDLARVAALTTLVLFQKVHVFNCRSEDVSMFKKNPLENKVLLIGVLTSLAIHIAAMYIPWTQRLLHFEPLSWQIWAVSIAVATTAIVVNELHKWLRPREASR